MLGDERMPETLCEILERIAVNPPPPTRMPRVTYIGRPNVEPPRQGVPGDLAAALAELPDRRSKVRKAVP